jgi:hypothetical protein
MRTGNKLITMLLALVALAGIASAQNAPCPECDEDGASNPENQYSSIDIGLIHEDDAEGLVDTDLATSHMGDEKGLWTWLSICLSVFVEKIENALGLDTGVDVDAHVEVYASEDGVDLDASIPGVWDFDESEIGHLDGETWEAMQDVNALRGDARTGLGVPDGFEGIDVDACVYAELEIGTCG